ncbi:MAG: MATE family efflux transporter [Deltaproteobacteria bacterium]|jgi:MATE family multidrug resistance protein|nr:MATE family efflux transporter [Deltaproteobacteria bacterium]
MSPRSFFSRIFANLKDINPLTRWNSPQGYREVLALCLPLIASTTASSMMLFTDRIFLSHYSLNAIAASLPAGVTKVAVTSFFMGVASYSGIFVAQYVGAKKSERAAAALWQGLYFALAAGILLSLLYFASPFIFSFGSQNAEIMRLEIQYFQVLIACSPLDLAMVVMSSFLAALGRAKTVMWVSIFGALFNIPLNWLLIFGLDVGDRAVIPELGVLGAAVATVLSWLLTTIILAVMIFNKRMEREFKIWKNRAYDGALMRRLIKYGWPGGVQFFMELFAFAFFSFAVSHIGELELACNNIVFSIEALSFFPMMGVGQAVSIMVGQAVGRGSPLDGARATKTGVVVSSLYVLWMVFVFVAFPRQLLSLFIPAGSDPATVDFLLSLGRVILIYVAAYSFLDGTYLCCFGAVKGAGDVIFPMAAMALWGVFGIILPILLLFAMGLATIHTLWYCMVFYVLGLTLTGVWRYKNGKWQNMRVIEHVVVE